MYLNKDNTNIYYDVSGEGEALILVHGVVTDSALFEQTARMLSAVFKVVTFDRRGNSRSRSAEGDPDHAEFSISRQAEDIKDLMDELGIDEAYIAGVSGGAVIGEYFLETYPERVKHLIMYEPAMLGPMMEEDEEFREWSHKTEALVKAGKINNALLRFSQHLGPTDMRSPARSPEVSARELGNVMYAFNSEIPVIHSYMPDMETMKANADRITVAAGEKSGDTAYVREAHRLADSIGKKVVFYPGGHNLPYDLPSEFALCITGTIMLKNELTGRI